MREALNGGNTLLRTQLAHNVVLPSNVYNVFVTLFERKNNVVFYNISRTKVGKVDSHSDMENTLQMISMKNWIPVHTLGKFPYKCLLNVFGKTRQFCIFHGKGFRFLSILWKHFSYNFFSNGFGQTRQFYIFMVKSSNPCQYDS